MAYGSEPPMPADTAPAWDGKPENPDVDGWHWMKTPVTPDGEPMRWKAQIKQWGNGWGVREAARYATYCGPCLTPAEVAARERAAYAAGAEAMREAGAQWHMQRADKERSISPSAARAEEYAAAEIRALPIPTDAAAALAEVVAKARREAFEEAAQIADQHRQRALAKPDWTDVPGEIECVADALRGRSGEPTP